MLTETWRALARRYVVYDIPDEMAACFDCNAAICPDDKYRTCPYRLAGCAALGASAVRGRQRPEAVSSPEA
jgi:hypothetical protein